MKHIPTLTFCVFLVRLVIYGASLGDALALAALAGLYGYHLYLHSKKQPDLNSEVKKELADLKTAVSALKLQRTYVK